MKYGGRRKEETSAPQCSWSCLDKSRAHPSRAGAVPGALGVSPRLHVRTKEGTGPESRRKLIVGQSLGLYTCSLDISCDRPGHAGQLRGDSWGLANFCVGVWMEMDGCEPGGCLLLAC